MPTSNSNSGSRRSISLLLYLPSNGRPWRDENSCGTRQNTTAEDIIEIRSISQLNNKSYRFNVPNPEQKRMHLTRTRSGPDGNHQNILPAGEYLWRVAPGQILPSDRIILDGPSSKGLFLHVENVQPRRRDPAGGPKNDAIAPT